MKIALVVHQFFPESKAGTEVLTLSVAHELQRRGHQPEVLTGAKSYAGAISQRYEYEGVSVERFTDDGRTKLPAWNPVTAEYNNPFVARYFHDYLGRVQPDLVHFFHLQRASASMITVCRQMGIPAVYTATDFWPVCPLTQLQLPNGSICHGPDERADNCIHHRVQVTRRIAFRTLRWIPRPLFSAAIRKFESWFPSTRLSWWISAARERAAFLRRELGELDRILVPTEHMKQLLMENGFPADRLQVLSYGTETETLTWRVRTVTDIFRVGFVGTMAEHKGAHILVEALRSIPSGQNIQLSLYGNLDESPGYRRRLLELAGKDSRIVFAGSFSTDVLGPVVDSFDVLVVPSMWIENTPLIVHAAQASGCPVIGSDVAGIREIIQHERNGLLFPMGSVAALRQLLLRLNSQPELLTRLSRESRPIKSIKQHGSELLAIYSEILARRGVAA